MIGWDFTRWPFRVPYPPFPAPCRETASGALPSPPGRFHLITRGKPLHTYVAARILLLLALLMGFYIPARASSLPAHASSTHFVWTPLPLPAKGSFTLFPATSPDSFWVTADKGPLFRFARGHWTSLPRPPGPLPSSLKVGPHHGLFASVTDENYYTHILRYDGARWRDDGLTVNVPMRHLEPGLDNTIWAFGDWGELYHRVDGAWWKVELPTDQHLTCFQQTGDGTLWIGTRTDGILHGREGHFEHIRFPGSDRADVMHIEMTSPSSGYASTRKGVLLRYNGATFVPVDLPNAPYELSLETLSRDGSLLWFSTPVELLSFDGTSWRSYPLPEDGTKELQVFPDGRCLRTTSSGRLEIGTLATGPYFQELTSRARVAGGVTDNSTGAAFVDVDGDGYDDLFILNRRRHQLNQLLRNLGDGTFSEITSESGLLATRGANGFVFGDVNGDGRTDAVFAIPGRNGLEIPVFFNTGGGHFQVLQVIRPGEKWVEAPRDMVLMDVDGDRDLDLFLVFHYGPGPDKRGVNLLYENYGHGRFRPSESQPALATPSFYQHAVPGDFNGDGRLDLFVTTIWLRDRLFLGGPDGFRTAPPGSFPGDSLKTNTYGAVTSDLDDDGDLDLLITRGKNGLTVLRNDGTAHFEDATSALGLESFHQMHSAFIINTGDLDLDGRTDLLLVRENGNSLPHILLQRPDGTFEERTEQLGIRDVHAKGVILGDIDRDGDPDLFFLRDGGNQLWLNQTGGEHSIRVHVEGSGVGSSAAHARIHLIEEPTGRLAGFRELDARATSQAFFPLFNSLGTPFGTRGKGPYTVRVAFSGGAVKSVAGVRPGQEVTVRRHSAFTTELSHVPGFLALAIRQPSIRRYAVSFAASLLIIVLGTWGAARLLSWSVLGITALTVGNLTAFWLILTLGARSPSNLKYIAPALFVLAGMLVPLGLSYSLRWKRSRLSEPQSMDELLRTLLAFDHGEWALSNLNSLKRLGEVLLTRNDADGKLHEQFSDRAGTFRDMTRPNLDRILASAKVLDIAPAISTRLAANTTELQEILDSVLTPSGEHPVGSDALSGTVEALRTDLRELRHRVFRACSSDAVAVARRTIEALEPAFREAGIEDVGLQAPETPVWSLVRSYELAGILDNCLRNSVRAMEASAHRTLQISVENNETGWVTLEVRDSGRGLDPAEWEHIFEPGVSDRPGGGQGLAQARHLLEKYGGRIAVQESSPGEGTTFAIHLKQGLNPSEATDSDRR